ncbi:RadC family protein [Balneola sp. MJW-20]|uniref:RadC family protein n=1 Tax=Gracilimonas aurantiaca TaxID=3234185 RepID=UPI003467BE9C
MNHQESFSAEHFQNRTVKDMLPDEQPREKLVRYGAESLSDAELLSILLRTGTRKLNVVDTARVLLNKFDGLHNLFRKNWKALRVIPGIADVKAITLEASFEIARRIQVAAPGDYPQITSPQEAAAFFGPKLRHLNHEVFLVAFLTPTKHLTGTQKISSGGQTSTIVEPAAVMREAILNDASSIILAHNHPSGNAKASTADLHLTKRLIECGKLLGIPIDDHLIIAGYKYVSLREEGIFN